MSTPALATCSTVCLRGRHAPEHVPPCTGARPAMADARPTSCHVLLNALLLHNRAPELPHPSPVPSCSLARALDAPERSHHGRRRRSSMATPFQLRLFLRPHQPRLLLPPFAPHLPIELFRRLRSCSSPPPARLQLACVAGPPWVVSGQAKSLSGCAGTP